MTIIGYARVSTEDQCLDLQIDALNAAGCDLIFQDEGISAVAKHRPGFDQAMHLMQAGDIFVVWKMDRAFRSLKNALDTLEEFEQRDLSLRCITENLDTTTAMGICFFQIRHSFAELERNLIRERTRAGMAAAKARGVHIGRPRKMTDRDIEQALILLEQQPNISRSKLAGRFNVSPRTINRVLTDNVGGLATMDLGSEA